MTIYSQIKDVFEGMEGRRFSTAEIKQAVAEKFGTNETSIIPSDYCYNRINKGIPFSKHLFIRLSPGEYKYVGEEFPYTGWIYQKSRTSKKEEIVGRWENGNFGLLEQNRQVPEEKNTPRTVASTPSLKLDQIEKLYEEYLSLLKLEIDVFGCKATETRHLIGGIGEFKSALETQGTLAKKNQPGWV